MLVDVYYQELLLLFLTSGAVAVDDSDMSASKPETSVRRPAVSEVVGTGR